MPTCTHTDAAHQATDDRWVVQHTIGRYHLRRLLSSGRWSAVWQAYDPTLARDVALKLLNPRSTRDSIVRERFVQEARALARLHHRQIAEVYDAGLTDETAYVAMELIDGRSLGELLAERGGLPLDAVVAIVAQVATALAALHERGFVHRDIKPGHIMVERTPGDDDPLRGRAVLLDLGSPRTDTLDTLDAGDGAALPPYAAPEQLDGAAVTPRTDVYQLAATTYALLAGRPPFVGDVARIARDIAQGAPPDLRLLRPDLPAAVIGLIAEGMAKRPDRRPADPGAFAAQLHAFAAQPSLPERGAPESAWPRPSRPAQSAPARPGDDVTPTVALPPHRLPSGPTPHVRPLPPPGASGIETRDRASVPPAPPLTTRRPTALVAGVAALLVGGVALALLAMARTGGGDGAAVRELSASSASTAATEQLGSPTVIARPKISDADVFDSAETRRAGEFEVGENVTTCFTLRPGSDGRPLLAVVTPDRADPPRTGAEPAVVARSAPIAQQAGASCHEIRVLKMPLLPGRYVVSVLDAEGRRLYTRSFTARAASGTTLLRDDFEDPDKGVLPRTSTDPARFDAGYADGEYVLRKTATASDRVPIASPEGVFGDVTIAVDARVSGDTRGRFVGVACRHNGLGHYRLLIDPTAGSFAVDRLDGDRETKLAGWTPSHAVQRGGAVNRLELTCRADTITAAANGTTLGTYRDGAFTSGTVWIGAGTFTETPGTAEARFDHLMVTQP